MQISYCNIRNDISDRIVIDRATIESEYEMFFYRRNGNADYDTWGYRLYSLGYVVDGVCKHVSTPSDFFTLVYSIRRSVTRKNGSLSKYENHWGLSQFITFHATSVDGYTCSGLMFDSIEAAQAYYDTGDETGLVRPKDEKPADISYELFKIGDVDFTSNILVPTYKVNQQDTYNEWVDGYKSKRRDVFRTTISGSFTIKFLEQESYFVFLEMLKTYKGTDGYTPVSLYVNNLNEVVDTHVFIDIDPENTLPFYGSQQYEGFEVKVEER